MKKLKLLVVLLLAVSVGLTGCKKDNDDDDQSLIIGKWTLTNEVSKNYLNDQPISPDYGEFGNNSDVFEFMSNKTFTAYEDGDIEDTGTYSLENNGKKLILNYSDYDEDEESTVKVLTTSDLVIYSEYVEGEYKFTSEATYKRQ